MNENLHNNTEPSISAMEGWQKMQALLDNELPVKKQFISKKLLLSYVSISLFIVAFLFVGLQLSDNNFRSPIDYSVKQNLQSKKPSISSAAATNSTTTKTESYPVYLTTHEKGNKLTSSDSSIVDSEVLTKNSKPSPSKSTLSDIVVNSIIENQSLEAKAKTFDTVATEQTPAIVAQSPKRTKKSSWNLLAGLGSNASISGSQDFQPYPVLEARYNISPRFYIAAGVTPYSPVSISTGGISKTVYLNDTISNIRLYNETTTYNRFHYLDIPVSVGVNLTKKISFQTGVQLSVMLNKNEKKILEPYDFQMNSLSVPVNSPVLSLVPAVQQQYEVKVQNLDYRFIAGLRYQINKATIGLMYQHGMFPIGKGIHANNNRNNIVALNVLFRLK